MPKLAMMAMLIMRAGGLIRRRSMFEFLRGALSMRTWMPALLLSRSQTIEVPAESDDQPNENLVGAIDFPHQGTIDRCMGQIDGWALSRTGKIDRVEILIDGVAVGNATLCVPRWDILSDLPEARVCGFRFHLPPDRMPAQLQSIEAQFVVRPMEGKARTFPPCSIPLGGRAEHSPAPMRAAAACPPRRIDRSRKPKVACFTHSLGYGGGQLYLQELLRQLVARDEIDFVVRSPQWGPLVSDLKALGIPVIRFQEPSTADPAQHDRVTTAIGEWLLENGFECVLANTLSGFYAVNAAAAVGLPSIWAVHESFPIPLWSAYYAQGRPGSEFVASRVEAALRASSAVIFESDATRQLFIEYDDSQRFLKVPYGVDISSIDMFLKGFDRRNAREALGISSDSSVVLCMGTIEQRKQQIFLAQAFLELLSKHEKTILLFVGDFPSDYSVALRGYLDSKNLNGRIRVFPTVADPYSWYALADSFVLLSVVESMPRSIMEAMAFGLPVLASSVFG